MKAVLRFEFDLPEEQQEYHRVANSEAAYGVLKDFSEELRRRVKYLEEGERLTLWQEVNKEFHEILGLYNVVLD